MSVSKEMAQNCAHQMHIHPQRGKLWNLLSEAELRIVEGTTADVEPSRGELGVDLVPDTTKQAKEKEMS